MDKEEDILQKIYDKLDSVETFMRLITLILAIMLIISIALALKNAQLFL